MHLDVQPTLQFTSCGFFSRLFKPASNHFGCICEQIRNELCCMKSYITINRTKWYCSKLCINLIITMIFFLHSLCHLSEQLPLVTCKQRASHFTPMMWFDFIRWQFHFIRGRFHYSNCIKFNHNNMTQNCISSETHNWCMYTIWEIETPNLWFTRCLPKEKWEVKRFLLVLVLMCFLWNNRWSVSRYIMGPFSGWWRQGGNGQHYLAAAIWIYVGQESVITDSNFSWICFQITRFIQICQYCSFGICL